MTTLGIDLGTTNTSAALNGEIVSFSKDLKGLTIYPSVVAFPPTGVTLVGTAARRRRAIDPKNTIYSSKRIIGRRWLAQETQEFRERYPFDLCKSEADEPVFNVRVGCRSPVDIAATILGEVRKQTLDRAPEPRVVIGVPAGFAPPQRAATREAARRAGFSNVHLIDEPVATAWAYLSLGNPGVKYAVVYDLGGGTFDFAVLDCQRQPFEVMMHDGDLYLGGDDVDRAIASWAADELLRHHGWDVRGEVEIFDRLILECERAKIRLSYAPETVIKLAEVDPAAPLAANDMSIHRTLLEKVCRPFLQRTFVVCDDVLRRVGIQPREVGAVFLAGGSSQLPMIHEGLQQYFGKPPRREFDPMEVLAIGASLMT